jgi:predicted GIY-YIG superfamily endonuclease
MYTIYKITSPSGKFYIGLTSQTVQARFDAHCTTAFRYRTAHPFWCAIRKYGKVAFTLEELERVPDLEAANAAEVRWIAELRSTEREIGYNISKGGGYDSVAGVAGMRKKMADPEWLAQYRANLSAGIRASRNPESYLLGVQATIDWRAANQVQSYKNGRRAARIATAAQGRKWTGGPNQGKRIRGTWGRLWIPSDKVRWARHAYFTKRRLRKEWAALPEEARAERNRNIGAGKKESYRQNPEQKAKNFEQIKAARAGVDRKKQAAAASAGQKAWWVELRKDPVRYAEYINRRRESLRANLRHRKRGTEEPLHD